MGRLMVITTPDLVLGFQLAGVETFAVDSVEQGEEILRRLLAGDEASLIVVQRGLLQAMSPALRRQIESSYRPAVMDIPGSMPTPSRGDRRRQISELIRRAIGFQITFGVEPSQTEED
jgi:vacuolar-type H+-ATPase subunit F/Vma7